MCSLVWCPMQGFMSEGWEASTGSLDSWWCDQCSPVCSLLFGGCRVIIAGWMQFHLPSSPPPLASLESSHLLLSLTCCPRPCPFVFYCLHWWLWSLTVYLSCPSFMVVCKFPQVNLNLCLGWEPLLGSIFLNALGCPYLIFANNSQICVYDHDLSPELHNHI